MFILVLIYKRCKRNLRSDLQIFFPEENLKVVAWVYLWIYNAKKYVVGFSNIANIAKGTTDPGVDCFDQ